MLVILWSSEEMILMLYTIKITTIHKDFKRLKLNISQKTKENYIDTCTPFLLLTNQGMQANVINTNSRTPNLS